MIAASAATLAYRKAVKRSRERRDLPPWMTEFQSRLPNLSKNGGAAKGDGEEELDEATKMEREKFLRMTAEGAGLYNRCAWLLHKRVTATGTFEAFIMANILAVGFSTGCDLQFLDVDPPLWIAVMTYWVPQITMIVFTVECALKIIAEGTEPMRFFTHPENGYFNTFDAIIVVAGYVSSAP